MIHHIVHIQVLQIKPKPPGAKTGSRRFPDVTGGMDSGFSSCAAPAFCRGPGILKIGRYMRVRQVTGKLQGRRMRWEGFRRCVKTNIEVARVKQFLEVEDPKNCEAEDSSCVQTESDSRSRVEVDIRTEETYMTYETYMRVGKARVRQTGQVLRWKCMGTGEQTDITETES